MGPIFLALQWLRGCYKGFTPFCAALSVKNPSVRGDEFLSRWRIFIADEIFCRRNFLPADFLPMGYWSLSMSPGGMGQSWVFWYFRGYGAGRAVGFALSELWGGGECLWTVRKDIKRKSAVHEFFIMRFKSISNNVVIMFHSYQEKTKVSTKVNLFTLRFFCLERFSKMP